MIRGDQSLVANVSLLKGCHVARHQHHSEQIAIHIAGKALWRLGDDEQEQIVEGGQVVPPPSNVWHEVIALEDTVIIDLLSPPGPNGG